MATTLSHATSCTSAGEQPCTTGTTAPALEEFILAVDNMHCGGCMRAVEQALNRRLDVHSARVNLSQRRVVVRADNTTDPEDLVATLKDAGYCASMLADFSQQAHDDATSDLMRRLGVAGFVTMNVMLLSVSVWSGGGGDMEASSRSLFHWLTAVIALPAIVYCGQPFFASARAALASWHVNMDVPISLGVLLATGMSLYQTATNKEHVYFDAAIMLLTFLLLGRLLDQLMRQRAAGAAENLLRLRQPSVRILTQDGSPRRVAIQDVVPGMRVLVAAGERFGVDGRVVEGTSNVDQSIITGESLPVSVGKGDDLFAGAVNLLHPLTVEVTAREEQSLLSEIATLMATAEQQRGLYVQIADRAAKLYAPVVHALAAITFIGWLVVGANWQEALPVAIAVLIITCPCALALAVPAVQVAAAGRLLKRGIILKSGDALERLAQCDTFVFDKTGTLTHGAVSLENGNEIPDGQLLEAASLAANSTHPYSEAIVQAARGRGLEVVPFSGVEETAGFGLSIGEGQNACRLGSATWCGVEIEKCAGRDILASDVFFRGRDGKVVRFQFHDQLKDDAASVIDVLKRKGYAVELLSGDNEGSVCAVASQLGIDTFDAGVTPAQKVTRLLELKSSGRMVAMIGDGLNDAPSLKAAHVSLSPATAAHISQAAADFVIQGKQLSPVVYALETAKKAGALVKQNFALAVFYNLIFVPLAMAGLVTPLIAAIAMSLSSISVTANAIRLHGNKTEAAI